VHCEAPRDQAVLEQAREVLAGLFGSGAVVEIESGLALVAG
jgi:hypothetical protein